MKKTFYNVILFLSSSMFIHTSWGGTSIKAWISEEGIANIPAYYSK